MGAEPILFQSTRPRGARLGHEELADSIQGGFNPRARVGRDGIITIAFYSSYCFNPRARVGRDLIRYKRFAA